MNHLSGTDLSSVQSDANCNLRHAGIDDLTALVGLEAACFDSDRISRRQFRYLLTKGKAAILVAEREGVIVGDVVLLFSNATSVARLYSIAVDPGVSRRDLMPIKPEKGESEES
jgi:ribosomal protein S18 acetylase RimI-like enzyme